LPGLIAGGILALALGGCSPDVVKAPRISEQELDDPARITVGEALHREHKCHTCHTSNGKADTGPTYRGLWNSTVTLKDGRRLKVDAGYLYLSIRKPIKHVVKGFKPTMPSYSHLSDEEIWALVAYVRSLRDEAK